MHLFAVFELLGNNDEEYLIYIIYVYIYMASAAATNDEY